MAHPPRLLFFKITIKLYQTASWGLVEFYSFHAIETPIQLNLIAIKHFYIKLPEALYRFVIIGTSLKILYSKIDILLHEIKSVDVVEFSQNCEVVVVFVIIVWLGLDTFIQPSTYYFIISGLLHVSRTFLSMIATNLVHLCLAVGTSYNRKQDTQLTFRC